MIELLHELHKKGQLAFAIDVWKYLRSVKPPLAGLDAYLDAVSAQLNNHGTVLKDSKNLKDAFAYFNGALQASETYAPVILNNMAICLRETGRLDESMKALQCALTLNPDYALANNNYGRLCADLKRFDEAELYYRKTLSLDPDYADTLFNYANLLTMTAREAQAEAMYGRLLSVKPDYIEGYNSLASAYRKQGRFAEAEIFYRRALAIDPDYPEAIVNLGVLLLSQGRFEEGWALYEWRYNPRLQQPFLSAPVLPFPQWRGEALAGKSLLIVHEQGLGDVIQFARYIRLLKQRGAEHITFVCQPSLCSLFETLEGVDRILSAEGERANVHSHDYWTFLLSVPLYMKTNLQTIPGETGYLWAKPALQKQWRESITAKGLKIGIVWKGGAENPDDPGRSLSSLQILRPLWDIDDVFFISLQKGQGEDEAAAPPADQPLLHLGNAIRDFADTAAIVQNLDLVICVDTAIAHLAGALGKPVWLMIPRVCDWRWLSNRDDSPWYPTMRLFRQREPGNWTHVIDQIKSELDKMTTRGRR